MKKISKNELKQKISKVIADTFSKRGKVATKGIKKYIKEATRLMVKKFTKALKKADKKRVEYNGKGVKKKKSTPAKKKSK